MSCWGGLETNVHVGPFCCFPAPRAVGHIPVPHSKEELEAQGGLRKQLQPFICFSVLLI